MLLRVIPLRSIVLSKEPDDRDRSVAVLPILRHVLPLEWIGGHGRILNVHTDMKVKGE
jgi:hypothetical protein